LDLRLQEDPEKVVEDQEAFYRDNLHRVQPNPPVVDFAKRVALTHPVGVASGGVWDTVTRTLEAIGLRELFEVVVTQDQVEHSKPAPDLFLEAAKRMGVDPSKCLVIEDGQLGIQAADAAGMQSILIEGG
jgi:HAD superfamily hydrolase (TIGR01509 family)